MKCLVNFLLCRPFGNVLHDLAQRYRDISVADLYAITCTDDGSSTAETCLQLKNLCFL